MKHDVHSVVNEAEALIRELLEREVALAKALSALVRATDHTYDLLQQAAVPDKKTALQQSVGALRAAIAAFEKLETASPELTRAKAVADMADKEIARLQALEDELSRSVERLRAWWEAHKTSTDDYDDAQVVGEKKDELAQLMKDAIDRCLAMGMVCMYVREREKERERERERNYV